ncbi:65-kDa microtubule-associated protein 5 [Gossypium australe]|uniref:65-kDa microtubule-associated protein 5 n=1 Tax=Gossypium australe TaxID=47621 RepID=A0A5B6U777_9ROSI|nr:65-kDa microtubule-associated protein 5 [Gossypium australe]
MTTLPPSLSPSTTLPPSLSPSRSQTTCASLLQELQIIWDEIGESDGERDNMLLELEQECLNIYRRKAEMTRKCKTDLHNSLAQFESEIAKMVSSLGEHSFSFSRVCSIFFSLSNIVIVMEL